MEAITELVNTITTNIPLETVLQALAAAGILSVILQKLKKWFELQSNAVINFLNALLSFIAVAVQALIGTAATNPEMLPAKALSLMGLTILAYNAPYIGIKSLTQLVADVKATRESKARAKAKQAAEIVAPMTYLEAIAPAELAPAVALDTPITVTPVTPDAFTPDEFAA